MQKKLSIGIIMDGNGRWASKRGLIRAIGHKKGMEIVKDAIEFCTRSAEIDKLVLFAFSSENWKRPKNEISFIFDLFLTASEKDLAQLCDGGIRVGFIGDRDALKESLRTKIIEFEERTKKGRDLDLLIAFNYGGRWDIINAIKELSLEMCGRSENFQRDFVASLDECNFSKYLSTAKYGCSDLDILIRTGAQTRISNFMLWQLSYSELFFLEKLWPDFSKNDLVEVMEDFKTRQRKFGAVN